MLNANAKMCVCACQQPVEPSPPAPPPGQGHHTALHKAAALGNSDAVAALIQGGCAIDLQDKVRGWGQRSEVSQLMVIVTEAVCCRRATLRYTRCRGTASPAASSCWSKQELMSTSRTR